MTRKSSTKTLVAAMRILTRDIQSGDGVANMAIAEAADRLEEQQARIAELERSVEWWQSCTKDCGDVINDWIGTRQQLRAECDRLRTKVAELEAKAADGTDWKAIAMALGQRVNWAISHISERGTGLVLNTTTGKSRHWKEYMAEALRMIPGLTIDDDILAAHCLPPGEKRKRFKQLAKRAEQEDSSHEQG